MRKLNYRIMMLAAAATLMLASCGTSRVATKGGGANVDAGTSAGNAMSAQLAFVQKVSDASVYTQNIVGDMTLRLQSGSRDISVPASLHMRKDKVIRLQAFIPLLGTEVGRIEFTPDYVLVIDRLHKEYVKADYSQVDFLKNNGLSFYSLQSLFWNQLLMPGKTSVSESDLRQFAADMTATGQSVPVSLNDKKILFVWNADRNSGQIKAANVTYSSQDHGKSTLDWQYSDFRSVGVKMFPATQKMTFSTNALKGGKTVSMTMQLDGVSMDSKWDERTAVPAKYKEMNAEDVLGKLMKMN